MNIYVYIWIGFGIKELKNIDMPLNEETKRKSTKSAANIPALIHIAVFWFT